MALGWYETLQLIKKQIKNICCRLKLIEDLNGIPGPPGPPGQDGADGQDGAPGGFGAYGSWYSTVDQINIANGTLPMTVNVVDFASGVSIVNGSEITFLNAGKYNIQFSAQFHNTGGGGSGTVVNIWFAKNLIAIPDSNTRITVNTNSPYVVAAWNYFVNANAGDYFQIYWTTDNANIILERENADPIHPAIPSVIITVNQVG
jgi:hypothetical protein